MEAPPLRASNRLNREKVDKTSVAARQLAESYSFERDWREMKQLITVY